MATEHQNGYFETGSERDIQDWLSYVGNYVNRSGVNNFKITMKDVQDGVRARDAWRRNRQFRLSQIRLT